jgi:hypothetical protein
MMDAEESSLIAGLALETAAGLNVVDKSMLEQSSSNKALKFNPKDFVQPRRVSAQNPYPPQFAHPSPQAMQPQFVPQFTHQPPPQPQPSVMGLIMPKEFSDRLEAIEKKLDRYVEIAENIEKSLGKILLQNAGTVKITLTKNKDENTNSQQGRVLGEVPNSTEQD